MKYWEDMLSKWGFRDGDAVPAGAELYRKAYILTVNALAERLESRVRAVAFDRGGMHNWALLYFTDVDAVRSYTAEQLATGEGIPEEPPMPAKEPDGAMDEAVYEAAQLDVDSYLDVVVTLDQEGLLRAITEKKEGMDNGRPMLPADGVS